VPIVTIEVLSYFPASLNMTVFQYYLVGSSMLSYAPSAVNALVAIALIKEYRLTTRDLLLRCKQRTTTKV
jgi:hypothetical protein